MKPDVLVLGGGIVGLSTALALAERGRPVAVLDRTEVPAGASWAAAGIVAPCAESLLAENPHAEFFHLASSGQGHLESFLTRVGWTDVLGTHGSLVCALDEEEGVALGARAQRLSELGLGQFWSQVQIANYFLPLELPRRVFECGSDRALLPRPFLARLRAHLETLGVTFLVGEIEALLTADGAINGVSYRDGHGQVAVREAADYVLCLASATSALPGLSLPPGTIVPVRGQLIEFASPTSYQHVVFAAGGYLVPRGASTVVGSTHEQVGFDCSVTDEGLARLRARAERLWPASQGVSPVAHWAGLRPATRDGLPLVGKTPIPHLFLNAGHYRNGISFATLCGEMVAAQIGGEAIDPAWAPLASDRLWSAAA